MSLMRTLRRQQPGTPASKWPLPPHTHKLEGERVILRLGQSKDWQAWRDLRAANRAALTPWEPIWPADALTFNYYSGNLRRQWREWKEGKGYAFLLYLKQGVDRPGLLSSQNRTHHAEGFTRFGLRSGAHASPSQEGLLIGGLALTEIVRGVAQKASLGYWLDEQHKGLGLMTEACALTMQFAFETLQLHRLEASCMPSNVSSKRLLKRLGFEREGLAKSYLRINGAWEDHEIWGAVREEPQTRP